MAPHSNKRLILVRHAHRDKSRGREKDNGLSAKGRDQAETFTKAFAGELEGTDVAFLSSPKRRCTETVQELAERLGRPIRVSSLLDEQHESEPSPRYRGRVKRFLSWWRRKAPPTVVACSHGDWIPEFLAQALEEEQDLAKGDWIELTLTAKGISRPR